MPTRTAANKPIKKKKLVKCFRKVHNECRKIGKKEVAKLPICITHRCVIVCIPQSILYYYSFTTSSCFLLQDAHKMCFPLSFAAFLLIFFFLLCLFVFCAAAALCVCVPYSIALANSRINIISIRLQLNSLPLSIVAHLLTKSL